MTVLTFTPRLDETQQQELVKARELIDTFVKKFQKAIQWNPANPIERWELLAMYSIDDILRDMHTITLYDFQAVEYLVNLYFSHLNEDLPTNDSVLKIAESSFVKYSTSPKTHTAWVSNMHRQTSL